MANRKSDYERWGNPSSLKSDWDERTFMLADMIPESATSIIEFGAANMVLKEKLLPHQKYTPSDLVDRGEGTIVYDLNLLPYSFIADKYDVAFFSGVLEYVHNVPELIKYVRTFADVIIFSYAHSPTNRESRKRSGWVNEYTHSEMVDLVESNSFKLAKLDQWQGGRQLLYKFIAV